MELKETAKKYWPYLLGGAVGLYLLTRRKPAPASQSANYNNFTGMPSFNPAQAQANTQAFTAQSNAENQRLQLTTGRELAIATLGVNSIVASADAETKFLAAQGYVAGMAGRAATEIITALQAPTIAAINASNLTDRQAILGGSSIANSAFTAMSNDVRSGAAAVGSVASVGESGVRANAQIAQSNNQNDSSFFGGLFDLGGTLIPLLI